MREAIRREVTMIDPFDSPEVDTTSDVIEWIDSGVTVGKTAGHTDVSIWYALKGDRASALTIDQNEFHEAR
jgi:hypothetical protein